VLAGRAISVPSEHDTTGSPRSAADTHGPLTCGRPTTGVRQQEWYGWVAPGGPEPVTASPLSRVASTESTRSSPAITQCPDLDDNVSLRRLSRFVAGQA